MSAASSKNNVPLSASSNFPIFLVKALVNAPFSYPKNSASKSSSGIAAQFISTNG